MPIRRDRMHYSDIDAAIKTWSTLKGSKLLLEVEHYLYRLFKEQDTREARLTYLYDKVDKTVFDKSAYNAVADLTLLKFLVEKLKINITAHGYNVNGDTVLTMAVKRNCLDSVAYLLNNHANPSNKNKKNQAPIELTNNRKIKKLLLLAEIERDTACTPWLCKNDDRNEMAQLHLLGSSIDSRISLTDKLITRDQKKIKLLAKKIRQSTESQDLLYKILELSKTEKRATVAAANAITILSQFKNLSNSDFSGIQIRGANLSKGFFENTTFYNANVQDTIFDGANLQNCRFDKAKTGGSSFGMQTTFAYEMDIRVCTYFKHDSSRRSVDEYFSVGASNGSISVYGAQGIVGKLSSYKDITELVFSRQNGLLAAGLVNGKIHVWDFKNSTIKYTLENHANVVTGIAFYGNKYLFSASKDKTVNQWDVKTGKLLKTRKENAPVNALARFPGEEILDPDRLAFGCSDGTIRIRDIESGGSLRIIKTGPCVNSLVFWLDGSQLIVGNSKGEAQYWNVNTWKLVKTAQMHTAPIRVLKLTPDGNMLVSGGGDRVVKFWDTKTGKLVRTYVGYKYSISDLSFSSDGKNCMVASTEKKLRFIETPYNCPEKGSDKHKYAVCDVAVVENGSQVVSVSRYTAKLRHVRTGKLIGTISLDKPAEINSVAIVPNSLLIAIGRSNSIELINLKDKNFYRKVTSNRRIISSWCLSPSGKWLASASDDGIKISNLKTCMSRTTLFNQRQVDYMDIDQKSAFLASGDRKGFVNVWEMSSGNIIKRFKLGSGLTSLKLVTIEKEMFIVTGYDSGKIKILGVQKDRSLAASEKYTSAVKAIFSYTYKEKDLIISWHDSGALIFWERNKNDEFVPGIKLAYGNSTQALFISEKKDQLFIGDSFGDLYCRQLTKNFLLWGTSANVNIHGATGLHPLAPRLFKPSEKPSGEQSMKEDPNNNPKSSCIIC